MRQHREAIIINLTVPMEKLEGQRKMNNFFFDQKIVDQTKSKRTKKL